MSPAVGTSTVGAAGSHHRRCLAPDPPHTHSSPCESNCDAVVIEINPSMEVSSVQRQSKVSIIPWSVTKMKICRKLGSAIKTVPSCAVTKCCFVLGPHTVKVI